MTRDDLIIHLINYYRGDEELAYDIWNSEDVNNLASETLTDEEIQGILCEITEELHPDDGITNDLVAQKIEDVIDRRDED